MMGWKQDAGVAVATALDSAQQRLCCRRCWTEAELLLQQFKAHSEAAAHIFIYFTGFVPRLLEAFSRKTVNPSLKL